MRSCSGRRRRSRRRQHRRPCSTRSSISARIWSGRGSAQRATPSSCELDAPDGPALVGTGFTSSGAADNGTFHDRSVVAEASRPAVFVIETDSRLDRTHGATWHAHFTHRYDVASEGEGSRITYTETISRVNYVPYWLKWGVRTIFRPYVNRADRKQLANLARLAEERSHR
ncbi:MAG TPA: SRPBCC family protein [Actinomycetota bacterium]|nr:SRPBCC family protein [Actinomycetota bacterium]